MYKELSINTVWRITTLNYSTPKKLFKNKIDELK